MSDKPSATPQRPQDDAGRFVPIACPDINCDGTLRYEGEGVWRCDGLVDPNDENKPLEACSFSHRQGDKYP